MSAEHSEEESGSSPVSTRGADEEDRALEERIASTLRLGLPAATLVCAVVGGVLQGAPAVVLVLAGGALVAVIAIFWSSVRTLVGETGLSGADAYALGAPRAEEEQKRAVLRALKDLEFERSVGKISDEDYETLVAKYRAEGKRLIRVLDEEAGPRRKTVEGLVHQRLVKEGLAESAPEPEPAPTAKPQRTKKNKPQSKDARTPCTECGTRNEPDAVFCKKCGARQNAEPEKTS
jgi:hypothetical protein